MKIGVSSYSFHRCNANGKMTSIDYVVIAKEMGFDGIEFVSLTENTVEYATKVKEKADEVGIEICCMCMRAQLIQETEEEKKAEIERIKKQIDIAVALGVKLVRHDGFFSLKKYRSFDLCLPELGEVCREISSYAEQYGIRTMIENHGWLCQGSERMEKIFNAVNYPNFGLLVDFGNFKGIDENSARAVAALASYTIHAHVKDLKFYNYGDENVPENAGRSRMCNRLMAVPAGEGDVNVAQCVDILKNSGYDGYLIIEYEAAEDCMTGIKKSKDFIAKLIK